PVPVARAQTECVASQNARRSVVDCLRALKNQCSNGKIEIIVVDNSTDETAAIVKREFPSVKIVAADKEKFIPELWGLGIGESTGEYVALTTSHFVPSATWTEEILKAHEQPFAGIGGAIENEEKAGLVSWAVYFCRYSPYMLPFGETEVEDFAADNASYKRRDLEKVKDAMRDGFWETFVHQEMRHAGMTLLKSPRIVVYHQKSFTFAGFMKQRLWHGRQFGETRALQMSALRRAAMIVLSPTIPLIYLFRITRRVLAKKRNIGKFFWSLPVLILFLLSWSSGEFSGYLWSSGKK
ncbi:MAG: glycosyltransferase, partial [Actinomycetota bacterium]